MNRTYRLIFNRSLGVMQVASELANGIGRTVSSPRRRARRLLALALLGTLPVTAAQAQTWGGGVGNWQDGTNWVGDQAPNGVGATAVFDDSGLLAPALVNLFDDVVLEGLTFTAGASAYDISNAGHTMLFRSQGVRNLSAHEQMFWVGGSLVFDGNASAGSNTRYRVFDGARMQMQGSSTLGEATVQVEVGAILSMLHSSDGADARIIANSTVAMFQSTGTMNMGSLEGSGWAVFSNANGGANVHTLTIGKLGTSTTFSGRIMEADTAVGGVVKIGDGTLTLTGDNTFSQGLRVQDGTVAAGHDAAFGTGSVTVSIGATWELQGGIAQANAGIIAGEGDALNGRRGAIDNLSGSNFLTGRITQSATGFIGASNDRLTLTGGIDLAGHQIRFNPAADTVIAVQTNGITGSGGVHMQGAGTLMLASDNDYTGGTVVSAGTLQIGGGGASGSISGNVENNSILLFYRQDDFTFNGAVSGTGRLVKGASGTLTLTNDNTHLGGTNIEHGVLRIGAGGTTGFISGPVTNDGTLIFDRSNAISFDGAISGWGGLIKNGSGILTLTGDSNYSGGTQINSGSVALGHRNALGTGSVTLTNGAELLASNSFAEGFGRLTIDHGRLSAATGQTFDLSGVYLLRTVDPFALYIGSAGNDGTVSISLDDGDFPDPRIALNVEHGSLRFGNAEAARLLASRRATTSIAAAASVDLNGMAVNFSQLEGAGTVTNLHANAASVIVGVDTNPVGTVLFDSTFDGTIQDGTGTVRLVKEGERTLTLTNANTYTGGTQINDGRLAVASMAALGTGDVILSNGAELLATASGAESFGDLITSNGRLSAAADETFTVSGLSLGIPGAGGSLHIGSAGNTGTVMLQLQPGSSVGAPLQLTVDQGTLSYGNQDTATALTSGQGTLQVSSGASVDLRGLNLLSSHLVGDGRITSSVAGHATVSLGGFNAFAGSAEADSVFAGTIENGAGTVELMKQGTRSLSLTGTHTYTGGTTINGGTLAVNGVIAGDVTVNAQGTLGGAGQIGGNVTVSGVLSAGNSPGTLTIDGNLTLQSGSISVFELGQPGVVGGAFNDLVRVGGDLALGGELNVSTASAGWYRLFEHTGTLSGAFEHETVNGSHAGFSVSSHALDTTLAGQLNLSVIGAGQTLQFWDGGDVAGDGAVNGGDGTWNNFGLNWTDSAGSANSSWGSSVAVFGGTAGTVTVDGTQLFDTLQFITDGYTVTGGELAFSPASGNSAIINVDGGVSATLDSALVDGSGSALMKVGAGTLHLTGANAYSGTTTISAGTLVAGIANLGGGAIINDGVFVLDHSAADVDFTAAISGSGAVHKSGTGTVRFLEGTHSYGGGTVVDEGVLIGSAGSFGSGALTTHALLELDQQTHATLANVIAGSGALHKTGAGVLTLTGASGGFTGQGELRQGGLSVDGVVGGQWLASSGTTLSGIGTLGSTTVMDGGRVSPGSAQVGTLTIDGDLTLAPGSTYAVDISGTASDLLRVTGSATVSGSHIELTTLDAQTSYQHGHTYTLLSAGNGLTGEFADVLNNSAFLTTALTHADDAVQLRIALVGHDDGDDDTGGGGDGGNGDGGGDGGLGARPPTVFPSVALTDNQSRTASALDTLAQSDDALALYNTLLLMNAQDARAAFDALSGEIHASTRTALLADRFLHNGIDQRLAGQAASEQQGRTSLWATGASASPRLDGGSNTASTHTRSQGLMAGVDWVLGERALIGVALGRQQIDHRLSARNSFAESDATVAGLYVQQRWGGWTLQGSVSHGDHEIDTRRVAAGNGLGQQLRSTTDADATTLQIEASWQATLDNGMVQPYLAVSGSRLKADASREQGGSTALEIAGRSDDLLTTRTGMRAVWDISTGIALTTGLGWQYTGGDVTGQSTHRFVAGSDAFTIQSAPLARHTALGELGISIKPTQRSRVSLSAHGRRGDGHSELGAQLQWQVGL